MIIGRHRGSTELGTSSEARANLALVTWISGTTRSGVSYVAVLTSVLLHGDCPKAWVIAAGWPDDVLGPGDNKGPLQMQRTKCFGVGLAAWPDGQINHLLKQQSKAVIGVTAQGSGQGNPCQGTVSTPPNIGGQNRQCRGRKIVGLHGAKAD